MPSWNVHLDVCRRVLGWSFCTEDLKTLDELIDTYEVHDIGRKDRRRDPVRFTALLVDCCLCLEGCSCGVESLRRLLELLRERTGDLDEFLLDVAVRADPLVVHGQRVKDLIVYRAQRLFGIVANIYIKEFVESGSEIEKTVLAWYLSTGSRLPISKKALIYALLHHVIDLMSHYTTQEPPGAETPVRVLERTEKSKDLNEIVSGLDYIVCGVEQDHSRCNAPSDLIKDLLRSLKVRVNEVYAILAYNRLQKGIPPGSRTLDEEIRELFEWLCYLRGLKGTIVVNGKPTTLVGAVSKVTGLLRRNRRVRIELFTKSTGYLDIQSRSAQPAIVVEAGSLKELRDELCRKIPGERVKQLTRLLPDLARLEAICQQSVKH